MYSDVLEFATAIPELNQNRIRPLTYPFLL